MWGSVDLSATAGAKEGGGSRIGFDYMRWGDRSNAKHTVFNNSSEVIFYRCAGGASAAGISIPCIQIENKGQIILTADNLPPTGAPGGPWLQDITVDSDEDELAPHRKRKRIPSTILDSDSDNGKPCHKRTGSNFGIFKV
ncbi:hypothetical protein B0H16DRAFT_1470649 [Mycena metata]|uniref:Uncharacterized protein n=1 Tax=Mycena metata TaxID=1033252 RepID=A0AAD7MQ80_9AGAR|nr:hypothetical protein B0H16DRAFT_1470649 [Mycena metata]